MCLLEGAVRSGLWRQDSKCVRGAPSCLMFFSIESEMGCGRAIRLALEKLGGAYRGPGDSNEGNCQTCGNMPA